MEVYRLTRAKYSKVLSGKGAAIKGARWNSIGVEMIYTASNRSLAMAEVSVYFSLATIPSDYMMLTIHIPDSIAYSVISVHDLKSDWNSFPHPVSTKLIGDDFVNRSEDCLLKVPSSITKGDFNYLINPAHHEFKHIKIIEAVKFPFNDRIFK